MKTIFSGAGQNLQALVAELGCLREGSDGARWCVPDDFPSCALAEVASSERVRVVWVFESPVSALLGFSSAVGDVGTDQSEILDAWLRLNRMALDLKARLGTALVFVDQRRLSLFVDGNSDVVEDEAQAKLADLQKDSALERVVGQALAGASDDVCRTHDALVASSAGSVTDAGVACSAGAKSTLMQALAELRELRCRHDDEAIRVVVARERLRAENVLANLAQDLEQCRADRDLLLVQAQHAQEELESSLVKIQGFEASARESEAQLSSLRKVIAQPAPRTLVHDEALLRERDLLMVQLHNVQEELEAYYARGQSLIDELTARPHQAELDALRIQLAATDTELQKQVAAQGDISRIHSRRLLETVAARLDRRFMAGRLSRHLQKRRLRTELRPLRASKWFDSKWYLATYPDVATSGIEPLSHYHRFGWKEGRNPGPVFDSTYYLNANADVRDTDMNPLLHFVLYGEREGRLPSPR
ncbi:hypothetical protein D3C81_343390 [compost metagenome]